MTMNMISTKRIVQLAKKWQRMAAVGRKRLTWGTTAKEVDKCCTSVASKGHCAVYTTDGSRFEVPLACLGSTVFAELLQMSKEEFGFTGSDGRITLPCDAMVMEYALCLLRRSASAELETGEGIPEHRGNVEPHGAVCRLLLAAAV